MNGNDTVDAYTWICLQSGLQHLQVQQDQGCPPEIQICIQVSTRPYCTFISGQMQPYTTWLCEGMLSDRLNGFFSCCLIR